jgi:hypothetical protein
MRSAVRFPRSNIPMPTGKHSGKFILAVLLCAALCACGSKDAASLSEGTGNPPESAGEKLAALPLDQQTEQKLDPLSEEDLELYLRVMRAAAERVQHLMPADQAALDGARKILATAASGRVPTRDDAKILERANLIAISMDQIVAEEMKLDPRTYRGIAEAVESVVSNPVSGHISGNGVAPASGRDPTPLEKQLSRVNAANETFLAPYREEIQKLIAIVRNPANLPK